MYRAGQRQVGQVYCVELVASSIRSGTSAVVQLQIGSTISAGTSPMTCNRRYLSALGVQVRRG